MNPSSQIPTLKESADASCSPSAKTHKMNILENQMQSKFDNGELNKKKKRNLQNSHKVKGPALTGHRFKEFLLQATKVNTSDCLLGRKDKWFQGDGHVDRANNSSAVGQVIAEKPNASCEGQRMVCKQKQQSCSTHETQSSHDSGNETPASHFISTTAKDHEVHFTGCLQDIEIAGVQKKCVTCGHDGQLLCCAGQGCSRSFHLSCITPPFTCVPPGVWHCIWCIQRKIDMDVYAVSEGIESILDVMVEFSEEGKQKQKKYLVKYKGLAHIHNRWLPGKTLAFESPVLFSRFNKSLKKVRWKEEWSVPQRLLAKRLLVFPEQSGNSFHVNNNCHHEWLVKWKGLGYDNSSWELENASFLRTPEALKLINDFEIRHKKADRFEEDKRRKIAFTDLPELPHECEEHLVHVKKLHGCWHRDQSALVIDDQERIVRVVLFVMSLLKDARGPFLIVTTSNSLSMWEAGFSRWGSHANLVVYKGCRNARSIIRSFEFYNENGDIMFQVLVSCIAGVFEDIENFQTINWEVVILDECQRPTILVHLEEIKLLAANMRLLLVSSQMKGWNFNYQGVLSLLDPEYDGAEQDILDANPSSYACKLKERLVHFIAYECQSETTKFMEFWVPAMLTDVQIEQYCAPIFSKSMLLCSSLKCDSTGLLHDIVVSTRKCCDHPFLVDWSLRSMVLKDIPLDDHFDVEIQLSGKLQLLCKTLPEIERRGLRVVIFFQSLGGSGTISIGDILDDFIHQKFGNDSYIRIDGNISRAKKQDACDMFNKKGSGKFICLIEARACIRSTKLSSVDTIIIFNSDLDPLNDLKALQKISIDSNLEQINIFRLYSSCTVEERVLMLAKEGVILDSNIKNIKRSICHKLLTWGASYLFRKLNCSSEFNVSSSDTISAKQSLLEDVFQELLHLLPHNSRDGNSTDYIITKPNSSHILNVQQNEGTYHSRFSLHGELIVQSMDNFSIVRRLIDTEPPHVFWTNLFNGMKPKWKYKSTPSQRSKRKVKYLVDLPNEIEDEEAASKKARTETTDIDNFFPKGPRSSTTKRYRYANDFTIERPIMCVQDATGAARDYAKNVQEHCKAINLHQLATSTNNDCHEGEPDLPVEDCSLPYQLQCSSNSTSGGDCISRGIQNGHTNCTERYACQSRATLDTSVQGIGCLSISSTPQSVQNLAPQPSVTSMDGSESDAASLGVQNTVPHYSSNHLTQTSWNTHSVLLQKQMEKMQKRKELAIKLHSDLKLQFEYERDKEIEEINRKYDVLIRNADNAMAETKVCIETCYERLHNHRLLAEATLQKHDPISVAVPQEDQKESSSPEEPRSHGKENNILSAVRPPATRDLALPEQDVMRLHAADAPAAASMMQVMQMSSEPSKPSAKTSPGKDQSSIDPGTICPSRTPSGFMHTSHGRPASTRNICLGGNSFSGHQQRAPAPHLRHTRPPPAL